MRNYELVSVKIFKLYCKSLRQDFYNVAEKRHNFYLFFSCFSRFSRLKQVKKR